MSSGILHPRRRLAHTVPIQAIPCFHSANCDSVPVNQLSKNTLCQIILRMPASRRSTMFADGFRSGCPGQWGSIFPVYTSKLWISPLTPERANTLYPHNFVFFGLYCRSLEFSLNGTTCSSMDIFSPCCRSIRVTGLLEHGVRTIRNIEYYYVHADSWALIARIFPLGQCSLEEAPAFLALWAKIVLWLAVCWRHVLEGCNYGILHDSDVVRVGTNRCAVVSWQLGAGWHLVSATQLTISSSTKC